MKKFLSIGAFFAVIFAFVLTGCQETKTVFTITFDSQGGSDVSPITVEKGQTVAKPTDPTKTNETFVGWYKEAAGQNAWNFTVDVVNSDITLYAKWEENPYPASNYSAEPKNATTLNLYGKAAKILQSGAYTVRISDDETFVAMLKLYPDGSDIEGTYKFSFSKEAETCLSSKGGNSQEDFPSVVMMYTNGKYNNKSYYLISGTVTVTATGVTVNATSYYGSTINITSTWYDFKGHYNGDYYVNGTHNFDFVIFSYGLFNSYGNLSGFDGQQIYIDFNSESAIDSAPQEGNYTFVSGGEPNAAGTFWAEYFYVENGVKKEPDILDGTITISASVITINLTYENGSCSVIYDGPISWKIGSSAPAHAPNKNPVSRKDTEKKKINR